MGVHVERARAVDTIVFKFNVKSFLRILGSLNMKNSIYVKYGLSLRKVENCTFNLIGVGEVD